MKTGIIVPVILLACIVASLLAACGGNRMETVAPANNAGTPAPASNEGADTAYALDYGVTKTYTKNTDKPYISIGDTLYYYRPSAQSLYNGPFTYSVIPKVYTYENALESVKSIYGEPYELKLNEKKKTPEALWQTEDGSFKMYLTVDYRLGKEWWKLLIIYETAANSQDQEIDRPYTTNTDMPPLKIGDVQFYKGRRESPGEYEFYSDEVSSDSVYDTTVESLNVSYGPCVQNHYEPRQEAYDMLTASWLSEDYTFSMDLILYKLDNGKRVLQLLVYKWPE